MNILLINHYAGSPRLGMEYRPYYMARAWNRLGHRTRVVASTFSHVRSRQPSTGTRPRLEDVEGVEYCWIPARPYLGNGLGRVRNIGEFVSGLLRYRKQVTAGFVPGAVISSSTYPLDAFAARRIARAHNARLVHEIHDLWPLSPMELGKMSRWHPFIAAMQLAENYAYRTADKVVSMLPKAEEHMRQHGLAPGKFAYVPNGIDVEEWGRAAEPLPPAASLALDGVRARFSFLVGYAGAHGLANALDALIDAANLLRGESVAFVLVGQGPEKAALKNRVVTQGLDKVLFLDPVPKGSIPALLSRMDALYIGLQRQPLFRFGVSPNKLMDYMMAGKPVIHAIEAGNDLVAESGCGVSVPPEDPAAIARAIRSLAERGTDVRRELGELGRRYIMERHTYDVLSARFLEVLTM